ncbi:hypothetical protein L6R46_11880 [Myxococcota bacterium]|nr:hypothetical protein [Myxococcota bacterium]
MSSVRLSLALVLALTACGEKKAPEPAPVAAVEPAPAPEPAPEPEVVPPPPEPPKPNADMNLTITYADGKTVSGHVKRIERSTDFYADAGWEDAKGYLTLTLEGNGTEKEAMWTEIGTITVTPGKIPADVDCTYSSDVSPWMYTCELKTVTTATTKDAKKWTVSTRYKWRLTFDDDSQVEFWLAKYPARAQDDKVVTIDDEVGENFDMYAKLQAQLRNDVGGLVKTITVK